MASAELETIVMADITSIHPSPENDLIYGKQTMNRKDFKDLVRSIEENGIREPIVISRDRFIISGHRRTAAAEEAMLDEVPVRTIDVVYSDLSETERLKLLRDWNQQRAKTIAEQTREALVDHLDTDDCEEFFIERERLARPKAEELKTRGAIKRSEISQHKEAMLEAAKAVIKELRPHWPLSIRQIHYQLLNDKGLLRNTKSGLPYENNQKSYKDLSDLLTRARIEELIPQNAIDDETRPFSHHDGYESVSSYIDSRLRYFPYGYYRDLMQSQEHHVELIAEKLTVKSYVEGIARRYCLPVTIQRGDLSYPPRVAMIKRWERSGKDQLHLIVVADLDPKGWQLRETAARSIVHDLGISPESVKLYSAAVNVEHIGEFDLKPSMEAKKTDSNYRKFVEHFGITDAYELEAMHPDHLIETIEATIQSVINFELYEAEREREVEESRYLKEFHRRMIDVVGDISDIDV